MHHEAFPYDIYLQHEATLKRHRYDKIHFIINEKRSK